MAVPLPAVMPLQAVMGAAYTPANANHPTQSVRLEREPKQAERVAVLLGSLGQRSVGDELKTS